MVATGEKKVVEDAQKTSVLQWIQRCPKLVSKLTNHVLKTIS